MIPRPAVRSLLLCVGVAVVIKGIYLAAYRALPFAEAPLIDSGVYLHQAQAVRLHRFGDPTLIAYSPLYGYFLALLHGDVHPWWPILAQQVLGLVNLLLVYRIARRQFGDFAGLAAAALYLGYGLFLFYESKILSETLGLTLALSAYGLFLAAERPSRAVGAGALLGLATLARASLIFTLPCFLLAALLAKAPSLVARLRVALPLAVGCGVVLGANAFWNQRHTGLFVPVILVSKTVAKSTSVRWTGDFRALSQDGSGTVSAWDVVRQAEEAIARRVDERGAAPGWHIDFAGYLRELPGRLLRTFSDLEMTSFEYLYYGERSEIAPLRALPITFGILALWGAAGALLLIRTRGLAALLPFLPFALGAVATTTLYHPSSRYRLPLVLPLLLLAGFALSELRRAVAERRRAALWLGGALAIVSLVLAARTLGYRRQRPALWEIRVSQAAGLTGRVDEAVRRARRACLIARDDPAAAHHVREVIGLPEGCDTFVGRR